MPRIALRPDFGVSAFPNYGVSTVLNMHAEKAEGKGFFPLIGGMGNELMASPIAPGRGQLVHKDVHYAVGGTNLYRVESDWNLTTLGTIAGVGPVRFAVNEFEIAIVSSPKGYTLDLGTSLLSAIDDPDFGSAADVCCLNNIGIFTRPDAGRWFTTRAASFRDIAGDDIATAESNADPLLGCFISANLLVLPGALSTEIWQSSGEGNPPFDRLTVLDIGCVSRETVAHFSGSLIWLARTRAGGKTVMKMEGAGLKRVATHAVERMIERAQDISKSWGFTYVRDGHEFYELVTDAGSARLDGATGLWTQTSTGDFAVPNPAPATRFVNCVARGEEFVFQDQTGALYRASKTLYQDAGSNLTRMFRTPVIAGNGKAITINRVELEMETGVSLIDDELFVTMGVSRDGGHTWPVQKEASIGARGKYKKRVEFRRLGQVDNCSLEFRFTGNAPFNVTGVFADIEQDLRS